MMDVSICIATYNKPRALERVLQSIQNHQPTNLKYEVVVVDDGSSTDEAEEVCLAFARRGAPVQHRRFKYGRSEYGNPAVARNQAYKLARAPVLICQSDDVVHGEGAIKQLVADLRPGNFTIAHVQNTDWNLRPKGCGHPRNPGLVELTGPKGKRPLFFLGAVRREDVCAIGGNEERFVTPGREDVFFVDCLTKGLGLEPCFSSARGYHLHHERPSAQVLGESDRLYRELAAEEKWRATGAPWPDPPRGPAPPL